MQRFWKVARWSALGGLGCAVVASALLPALLGNIGATEAERSRALPGDEQVPVPRIATTQAITIRAAPAEVWPWLAQLGQGRGGLYSYDFLENLIGCDIHSADRILPEHQKLRVGDRISLDARISDSYRVLAVEPGRVLVLAVGDADTRSSWTFFLEERGDEATRLLVRSRLTYPPTFGQWFVWRAVTEPLHVVMQEKMLRGIRDRAERAHRTLTPGDFVPGPHVAELVPETHAPR